VADGDKVRIELAFQGGQTLTVSVTASVWDDLGRALGNGDAESFGFDADDGSYVVSVRRIVFVKRFVRESRVGFGAGS
jgi:hypothetical protein